MWRKKEEKLHGRVLKLVFLHYISLKMDQVGPKIDQQGLEMVLLYRKFLFFAQILFSKHTLSEEIILNEIGQEGSHTINFALSVINVK